ncbi:lytic transglycosylase domain-containing protein [Sandaracinobacter sp. RS1-74]|uniref:lytic transglycosylase domain-containing protein n=1 Tax=Sandaracinobacteroides sayramensis TaxID=2913411 RepID=UPI001EDB5296|nr:lytic transglycosylase domain-containing protein [Sandaracinobacteroides sayramensis]
MIRFARLSLCAATLALGAPLAAQDAAPETAPETASETINVTAPLLSRAERSVPPQLNAAQRGQYARIFRAIEAGRVSAASQELAAMPPGILHPTAEGQILLAQGSGAGLMRLVAWLESNPAAPQAATIAGLARKAGATSLPPLASLKRLTPVRLTPPLGPRSARTQTSADTAFATAARAAISGNRPADVEGMLDRYGSDLSAEVRSEWAQRAAWDAYLDLEDPLAERLGRRASNGSGEWAAMGYWVAGLAAFRQNDCEAAAKHFDAIGQVYSAPTDLRSAGAYWAARSHVRCGRPWLSTERLKAAVARDKDGFYGLLATEALGLEANIDWREPDFIQADWTTLKMHPGAQRAAALVEIGQLGLADRELRHLAAATGNDAYEPILRLAARLDLPATQYWLAQNPPPGLMPPMSARFPTPDWKPVRGWRVDKSLVFAHALQESKFITGARSGAGAKGLMQIMPGTARDLAKAMEIEHRDDLLADPSFNVEYGQSYLEMLRDSPHTQGQLPKVIAAYNAGPGSVQKWNNGGLKDNGDVLLFIESIPFRETRHYVEVVMRNFWLYQMKEAAQNPKAAAEQPGVHLVAANRWPRFPQTRPVVR